MKLINFLRWCIKGKEYYEVAFPLAFILFFASLLVFVPIFGGLGLFISSIILLSILLTIPIYMTCQGIYKSWKDFLRESEEEKEDVLRKLRGEKTSKKYNIF